MAETLYQNRIANWDRELPTAIGGDYLTEDQAAALRAFLERLAKRALQIGDSAQRTGRRQTQPLARTLFAAKRTFSQDDSAGWHLPTSSSPHAG